MDNVRLSISNWIERLEDRWIVLPLKSQKKIIFCSFIGYILITIVTIIQVCYEITQSKGDIQIEHISPLPKDKVPITITKNRK